MRNIFIYISKGLSLKNITMDKTILGKHSDIIMSVYKTPYNYLMFTITYIYGSCNL